LNDHRGNYLIRRRSEVRGIVGIGLLTVALIAGGGAQQHELPFISDHVHTTYLEAAEAAPEIVEPTPPPPPPREAVPVITAVGPVEPGIVTHYGVSYNGNRMGCHGTPYSSENETIIAVGPADYGEWPCGTTLRVCGPTGCVVGFRQDSCPGCGPNHLDLSEAGINTVCGDQAHVCRVQIEEVVFEVDPLWVDEDPNVHYEALDLVSTH
jgi:hypothetical protein